MYSNILTSFKDCLCTPFEISKIFKYFVNRTRLVAWFTYVLHAYIYMLPKSVRITFYKHLIIFQTFMPIIYWLISDPINVSSGISLSFHWFTSEQPYLIIPFIIIPFWFNKSVECTSILIIYKYCYSLIISWSWAVV